MKNLTILLIVLIFSGHINAQQSGRITGRVADSKDNSPLAEAVVKLSKTGDSAIVAGTVTGKNGGFTLERIPFGMYSLRVSYIGYLELHVDNIVIGENSLSQSFDTLKLSSGAATTNEIDVEASKQLMTLEGDKKVFNVSGSMLSKGGTALDVLKKTPLVDVDINDNVSLRGSQNVKILVDDKPSRYASLKQVPADAIEKVEIITNPPAKYEAEGVTGIINIVMKKNDALGFTGNANVGGSYNDRFRGWSGLSMNMKKKNLTYFTSLYSGLYNFAFNYNGFTQYSAPNSSLTNLGGGNGNSKYVYGQGGLEYEISPGHTFGLNANYSTGRWGNSDTSISDNFDAFNSLSSFFMENAQQSGIWQSLNADMYYNSKIDDKGRELNADLSFSRNRNTNNLAQIRYDFGANNLPADNIPFDQRDSTELKNYNVNAQVDYTHPFSKTSKLETGYKGTFRSNDNNYTSDTMNYNISSYFTDATVSNHFKLSEYINAVYGVFSGAINDKLSYKLGLRLEQTNSKGELFSNSANFTKSYLDYFPTVNISQKIGAADQLQFSFSRRITRPNIWRMNPFVRRNDARFYVMGNPDLNPEYTNSYELSYMFFTKAVTVTPLLFYRRTNGIISNYSYLIDSVISLTTFRNAAGSNAYGMDLLINSSSLGWMNLNATLSLYDTKFDQEAITDYSAEEGFSWKANIRASFVIGKLFNIEAFYSYTGKQVNSQGIRRPNSDFDIGISKTLLDDKLTLSLKANDIFRGNNWETQTNGAGYVTSFNNNWDSRQVSLNVSFNFGNTNQQYHQNNKTKRNSNEDNDSQDSGNNR